MGVATFKRGFLPFLIFYRCQPYGIYSYRYIIGTFEFANVLAIHNDQIWNKKIQGIRGKGLKHKG